MRLKQVEELAWLLVAIRHVADGWREVAHCAKKGETSVTCQQVKLDVLCHTPYMHITAYLLLFHFNSEDRKVLLILKDKLMKVSL